MEAYVIFAVVLSFCVWMWGSWVGFSTPAAKKWIVRAIAVALAVWAGWAFLPQHESAIDWQDYDAAQIEQARRQGRGVLIDFTADWCLSCKAVDRLVYGRDDVAEAIQQQNVLAVKADTTHRGTAATRALKETYNEPGVPVSILLLPGREEPVRWRGKDFGDELIQQLGQNQME
jgi:thiol:disulfide interchange protein DsbD